jgi:phosphatidylglycerol:prolipoprotein diacylglycerol transferase
MLFDRCYPKITDWLYLVTNETVDLRFLPIFSYGFWVAVGFMAAAYVIGKELKRREALGLFAYTEKTVSHTSNVDYISILFFAALGYLIGWKGGEMVTLNIDTKLIGIALAAALSIPKLWMELRKEKKEPYTEIVRVFPSDLVGDFVVLCAIFGVLGSNLFNFLESPQDYANFWKDPVGSIFSGLSVYGGMICAGIALLVYSYVKKINVPNLFDALAYCFILANGIGRIGCQVSGDGDWGVVNTAAKPALIPQFLWASTYAHNIADTGVYMNGCTEAHCFVLPLPVFPTPIYEFLMCTAIFLILHVLRKRMTATPGMLFFLFFILIGIQRYSIEQIRDLSGRGLYYVLGVGLKQSELISIILVIAGILGMAWTWFYYNKLKKPTTQV